MSFEVFHPKRGVMRPVIAVDIMNFPKGALSTHNHPRPLDLGDIVIAGDPSRRNDRNVTSYLILLYDVEPSLQNTKGIQSRHAPAFRYRTDFALLQRFASKPFSEQLMHESTFQLPGKGNKPLLLPLRSLQMIQHLCDVLLLNKGRDCQR